MDDKEAILAKFNENVRYLERNVPPDDIYVFTEQTFMAALYFLSRWNALESVDDVCRENAVARKWVYNIMGLLKCRMDGQDIDLDLGVEE